MLATNFNPVHHSVKALTILVFFHLGVIASSNYLVQIPFTIFGLDTTWGAFTFPFIFLATDLTVRFYGARSARIIIFWAMLPALAVSYIVSVLFYETSWQGWLALTSFNLFVARIAFASFCAYVIGQVMDILVFNKLRQYYGWWVAPTVSLIVGNLVDTVAFFSIAFYKSPDLFMAAHWPQIAGFDYAVKVMVCLLLFMPLYAILLNYLLKKLAALDK